MLIRMLAWPELSFGGTESCRIQAGPSCDFLHAAMSWCWWSVRPQLLRALSSVEWTRPLSSQGFSELTAVGGGTVMYYLSFAYLVQVQIINKKYPTDSSSNLNIFWQPKCKVFVKFIKAIQDSNYYLKKKIYIYDKLYFILLYTFWE